MTNQQITVTLDRGLVEHLFERCTDSTNAPKVNGYSCEDCRAIGTLLRSALDAGEEIEAAATKAGSVVPAEDSSSSARSGCLGLKEQFAGCLRAATDKRQERAALRLHDAASGQVRDIEAERDSRLTTERARYQLRETFETSEWPKNGTDLEYFIRRVFPDPKEPTQ